MAAMASWILGGKTFRTRRNNQSHHNGDHVQLDYNKDPCENMFEILDHLTRLEGVSDGRKLSYLNAFVTLERKSDIKYEDFGYSAEEILYCLRPLAFSDNSQLKNACFRAVRYFIKTEEHVDIFIKLKYDFLVARHVTAGGIQLCRRVLVIAPEKFTCGPVQAMVALSHPNHSDSLQAAALAFLAETAILNPDLFIGCGGVKALVRNLPYLKPKMTEALLAPILYLINRPDTREKAGINLRCLTDPSFMDRTFNKKATNGVGVDGGARLCTRALVCLLRAWPGLLHLASTHSVPSIVNSLYVPQLQRPMLACLYEVFELVAPDWTDEMRVALDAINPSRWQPNFSLNDGFVAAEALATHPHIAKARVNLVECHLAMVLRTLLEANLLDAVVHVIVSDDTFLSVQATILLGELLGLAHNWLPFEVTNLLPGLPNLISYAIRGRPVSSSNQVPSPSFFHDTNLLDEGLHDEAVVSDLWNMVNLIDLFSRRFSIDSQDKVGGGCAEKQSRAQSAVTALSHMGRLKRSPPSPSLYLAELTATIHPTPSVVPLLSGSIDDCIKESGVLTMKDGLTWNWDTIQAVLKGGGEIMRRSFDSTKKAFLRRLVAFLMPAVGRFCYVPISADKKSTSKLTLAALDLITLLVPSSEDSDSYKLLQELLLSIKSCIVEILSSKSAHDCFISPHACSNTHARDYFLLLARLGRYPQGRKALSDNSLYSVLTELIMTTNHDCYIKLIISALDYGNDENARKMLSKAVESKLQAGRMYSMRMLHSLLRLGVKGSLMSFIIYLCVIQLGDEDKAVASYSITILHEACDNKEYVECLIEQAPSLARLGDQGVLLLTRCLSTIKGFKALDQGTFIHNQLSKWANHFNYRYVSVVENSLCEAMTEPTGGGRWQEGVAPPREAYLPPHLYHQLAQHPSGLSLLLADPAISTLTTVIAEGKCWTETETLALKAALYALCGIAIHLEPSLIGTIIHLATKSPVYSIRAVAYFCLCSIATTRRGVERLNSAGWWCVRHDRHEKWALIQVDMPLAHPLDDISDTSSELNKSASEKMMDSAIETDCDEMYWGVPGGKTELVRDRRCLTLPPQSSSTPEQPAHNRSVSESRADVPGEPPPIINLSRPDWRGRKARSNSYTDSSTSCDSPFNFRQASFSISERRPVLSPIQSVTSLSRSFFLQPDTTLLPSKLKRSDENMLRTLPQPTPFPEGLITYGDLVRMNSGTPSRLEAALEAPENADFSTIDEAEMPSDTLSSSQATTSSQDGSGGEECLPAYMGICMPERLCSLFPPEDHLVNHHVAFMASQLPSQGFDDLKNPWFHREICFLGTRGVHNTMVSISESESGQYIIDGDDIDLDKEPLRDGESNESSITDVPNISEHPMPIVFKSRVVVRSEISRMVEQLANPLLHKACKQSLLQIKQSIHGDLFEDVCVFSDISYILSRSQIRIASREFIHELFVSHLSSVWTDARDFLQEINTKRGFNTLFIRR